MTEFLTLLTTFPVVLFTAVMALVLLYWLLVILGAVDIDLLDIEGLAEALDGGLDGALDGVLDGGLEAVDGGLEAGAEGAADVDASPSGVAGVVHALGLQGVPLTISLSILTFLCWVVSMLLVGGLSQSLVPVAGGIVFAAVALVATLFISTFLTARVVRPMRPAFKTVLAPRRSSFTGRVCTIVSNRVDGEFGRAEIEDGGAGLLVDVRCSQPNGLKRGDFALVFDYNREDDVFLVSPAEPGLTA